jgi:hypothetical protein
MDDAAEAAAFDEVATGQVAEPTEPAPPAAAALEPVVETPAPETFTITKAEWDKVLADAGSVAELKQEISKRFDTTFGKMGGLERTLTQLQQATPAGQPIVVSEDDLAELKADGFPDLTKSLAAGLTRIMGKLKGTGPAAAPVDWTAQIAPIVNQAVTEQTTRFNQILENERIERLTDLHPNWREIAGPKDSKTEYREWLSKQADGSKVLESDNPREVAQSITRFLDEKKQQAVVPPKPGAARSQRFADAVPAKGGSGATPANDTLTEDDAFEAAFKKGRSH